MDLTLIEEKTSSMLIQAIQTDLLDGERIDKIEIVDDYGTGCVVRVLTSLPSEYFVDKRIPRIWDWQFSRRSGRARLLHSISIATMENMLKWAEK